MLSASRAFGLPSFAAVTEGKAKYVYLCYIRQSQNWEQVVYLSSHAKSEKVRSWMFQIISER